jgi:3-dehydroquinate synthase
LERITISGQSYNSEILIGEKWINFRKYISGKKAVIITDDNLHYHYSDRFQDIPFLILAQGENNKNLESVNRLAVSLLDKGIDRGGFILGIGGGVVCDVAGFLASVYMRGIKFGFVSTSLLSMVDASVGGKNGVNVDRVKNIIGTFNQPEFVICDPAMLKTLPEEEYVSGLAELIKHGTIRNPELFAMIENGSELIMNRDPSLLEKLITISVRIKSEIVMADEKEEGKRMLLNFGHTFGHAIEAHSGLKHGFAVAAGMMIAADISVESGILSPGDRKRLFDLLNRFTLLKKYSISFGEMKELVMHDKKKTGNDVNFVMLEGLGKPIVRKIPIEKLLENYLSIINKQ